MPPSPSMPPFLIRRLRTIRCLTNDDQNLVLPTLRFPPNHHTLQTDGTQRGGPRVYDRQGGRRGCGSIRAHHDKGACVSVGEIGKGVVRLCGFHPITITVCPRLRAAPQRAAGRGHRSPDWPARGVAVRREHCGRRRGAPSGESRGDCLVCPS